LLFVPFFKKPDSQSGQNYSGKSAGPEWNLHSRGNNRNFKEEAAQLGARQKKKENTND
jgi:hypothetical protein